MSNMMSNPHSIKKILESGEFVYPKRQINGLEITTPIRYLDLVITKDHIPIVYHDFYINPNICLSASSTFIFLPFSPITIANSNSKSSSFVPLG